MAARPELYSRWRPTPSARGAILIVHGYGEHSGRYEHVFTALNARGFSCLGIDYRGFGQAKGRRAFIAYARMQSGLQDLEGFSHLWILFWCHHARGTPLQVRPPRDQQKRGVFATRAPQRPNLIGMSCVRLLRANDAGKSNTKREPTRSRANHLLPLTIQLAANHGSPVRCMVSHRTRNDGDGTIPQLSSSPITDSNFDMSTLRASNHADTATFLAVTNDHI